MLALPTDEWKKLMATYTIDPYLIWSDLTKYRQFQTDRQTLKILPFLVELKCPYDPNDKHGLDVPGLFCPPLRGTTRGCFVTARISVPEGDSNPLPDLIKNDAVQRVQLGFPVTAELPNQQSSPQPVDPQPIVLSYDPVCDVVCGLMDDGCAFAHDQFRVVGQPATRVVALWDQTPIIPATDTLPYGKEILEEKFDCSIERHWLGNEVEEGACYRETFGAEQHGLDCARTHGTAVMDLFAGRFPPRRCRVGSDRSSTMADSPIVFVQFPVAESTVANGRWLATHVLEGLYYIFDAASRLEIDGTCCDSRKIVVALSYGALAGPHDGTGMLSRALEGASRLRGNLGIVLAAGNSRSARCHAIRVLDATKSETFNMIVPPVKPFETYAEIWLDNANDVQIEVTAPNGLAQTVTVGEIVFWKVSDLHSGANSAEIAALLVLPKSVVQGMQGTMALLALAGSELTRDGISAPAGKWEIVVTNNDQKKVSRTVRIWIERDDLLAIHPQQYAHFDRSDDDKGDDPEPNAWNDYVTANDTLASVAGAEHLYAIGGYTDVEPKHDDNGDKPVTLANYSGKGHRGEDDVPFLYACTDEGFAALGLRVAGTRSGSYTRMSGTSVAAPQAARALVKAMYDASGPLSADQIQGLFCGLPDGNLLKYSCVGAPPEAQGPLIVIEIAPAR